jgi:RecA-family ATPase
MTHNTIPDKHKDFPMFDTSLFIDPANLTRSPEVVEGLIPNGGLSIMFGKTGTGKTTLALDMAMHISAGRPWAGRAVMQGYVVYLCGEGLYTLKTTIPAIQQEHGFSVSPECFKIFPRAVDFTDRDVVEGLIRAIREAANGEPVVLVVIDPLDLAIPEADKSDVALKMFDLLRDKLGCAILLLHQEGKQPAAAMRGARSLSNALDTYFVVKSKDRTVTVHTQKHQQWGAVAKRLRFHMKRVTMTEDIVAVVPVYGPP